MSVSSDFISCPSRFILAGRMDGLGCRLRALMVAMALAKYCGLPMRVYWEDNKSDNSFHDVKALEDTFSDSYIADHCVSRTELAELRKMSLQGLLSNKATSGYYDCPQSISGELRNLGGFSEFFANLDLRVFFDEIGFSELNAKAIEHAYGLEMADLSKAIHLRAGDVVYGNFRRSGHYVSKVIPFPLVNKIIPHGGRVVAFCQDSMLVHYLREFDGVEISDDYACPGNSGLQKALFDIVLMSRCKEIIAGSSGFSMCAAMLGGQKFIEPRSVFSDIEIAEIVSNSLFGFGGELPVGISGEQAAFAALSALSLGNSALPSSVRFRLISLGQKHDPTNGIFSFLLMLEYFKKGDYKAAEEALCSMSASAVNHFVEAIKFNYSIGAFKNYIQKQSFDIYINDAVEQGSVVATLIMLVRDHCRGLVPRTELDCSNVESCIKETRLNEFVGCE